MSATPMWGRCIELLPGQQQQIIAHHPICWLPWATLTPHGPHLARGVAALIAEAVATGAARRVGGVVYPLLWHERPADDPLFQQWLAAQLISLAAQGFQMAVVIGLPESATADLALIETAEMVMAQHHLLTLAIAPFELVDSTMHDQGALWETSLLEAIRPDLVDRSQPVLNDRRDVRDVASPSLGQQALTLASEQLAKAVQVVHSHQNTAAVAALYQQRRARYHRLTL